MQRKIIHVDMDAFFASVEQRDHPELREKPIAVGYDGDRGVVSTASYEARRYGVHSAQSVAMAKRRCPQLIVVPGNYAHYQEVSRQIHKIFHEYTDQVEPLSLDEAFLDVTVNKVNMELAVDMAREIKRKIRDRLHLTASAGVSYNKLLAKIASDYRKPDGLCTIHPDKALDFIATLPVERLWGVGDKTAKMMHYMGIFNGAQLRQCSLTHLTEVFGKMGPTFYYFARGIDPRPVKAERERKSVGCEHTFATDLCIKSHLIIELYHLVLELVERIDKDDFEGRTLTLKIKYGDFRLITRSLTAPHSLRTKADILPAAKQLLALIHYDASHPIRLMGLSVSKPNGIEAEHSPMWVEQWIDFDAEHQQD